MIYKGEKTKNISFPLGGIGTGCIGLGGNGELLDWEIFNRPDKNSRNGYSHFAIKAKTSDKTFTKVLHGDTHQNLMGSHLKGRHIGYGYGPYAGTMAGYPHFKNVTFDALFPMAKVVFEDSDFPAKVTLRAFNPFIPHDEFNSSLPAAFFEWEITNTSKESIDFTLAFTLGNPAPVSKNTATCGVGGIVFKSADKEPSDIGYLDLCAVTDADDFIAQEYWYRGRWKDGPTVYWKNLSELEKMPKKSYGECGKNDHGTLSAYVKVDAGNSKRVRFVLAWNVPNQYNYWSPYKDAEGRDVTWKNYYATQFENSEQTAKYALAHFEEFKEKTESFKDAMENSSVPEFVKDAASANLSVLKSPTVLRLDDGSFWAWEGCDETAGSCEGSCQHVWNYAYALAYLFPALERSMRENTMKYALDKSGKSSFRVTLPRGREPWDFRACVDGQMGEVIKCYREWKMSGDTEWLKAHADEIFSMLEYAWSDENPDEWDRDRDGVMEGRQHHTLDMELFGPSSWLQGFYLLALDCGAKMASALGDKKRAKTYRELYEKGKAFTNEQLFNGEYFAQKTDLKNKAIIDKYEALDYWNDEAKEIKYQVADGCIIDQMLSDYHAVLIGADGIFDKDKKRTALESLFKYNYKPSMREITNMWRNFSLNDEAGTVICSYPEGVKVPAIPIPYCEETMTGFEYALGVLMIAEGKKDEGEKIIKAVRDRYDGEKRNPWNEIECGSNYARSMASFSLLPVYAGFEFDMTRDHIGFKPLKDGDGEYMFSIKNSWGYVRFADKEITLKILGEPLTLASFGHKGVAVSVTADTEALDFSSGEECTSFEKTNIKDSLVIKTL